MEKEDYLFSNFDSSKKKPGKSTDDKGDSVLDNRRVDDTLLQALSLVLSSNSEYARSMSALLENDLEREQLVSQINNKVFDLYNETKKLVESQENLTEILNKLSNDIVSGSNEGQKIYLDTKFAPIYTNLGLKIDGTDYNPADKFLMTLKKFTIDRIWYIAGGAVIYHFIRLIFLLK